jgi:hypothetical protein
MDTTTNTILTYIALGIGFLTAVGTSVSLFMHWLAPRTPSKWDDNALVKLDELLAFLRGLSIPTTLPTDTAPSRATSTTVTSPQTPSAKAAQAGRARLSMIAALALGATALGGAIALAGCSAFRSDAVTGGTSFIDCETPDIIKLLPDLLPLAEAEVAKWIGGSDETIDASGLAADLAGIKGDVARCAIAAAGDVLASHTTTVTTTDPAALVSTDVNGAKLRATFASVRGGLGWAPLHLAGGKVM